jgi:hypothetical protein
MDHKIQPDRITKPIQLLGAWLVGLLAIDTCFLTAAAKLPVASWEAQALTVAAIVNVPLFLLAVFLLQTKFRPELQEDLYYSSYISQKTNTPVPVSKEDANFIALQQRLERIESKSLPISGRQFDADFGDLQNLKFGINRHLNDKELIAKRLGQSGIVSYSNFGVDEPPSARNVAISHGIPSEVRNRVLRLAAELGFRSFSHIEAFEEIDEDVLFGSYGNGEFELTPVEG